MVRLRVLPLLVAVALVAAACGSDTAVVVAGPSVQAFDAGSDTSAGDTAEGFRLDTSVFADGDEAGSTGGSGSDDGDPSDGADDAKSGGPADGGDPGDGDGGGVAAGVSFLRGAASETSAVASYRFEVRFEMFVADGGTVLDIAPDAPLSVGAVSGTRTWVWSDIGPIFDAIGDAAGDGSFRDLLGDDLTMEAITEGTTLYVRSPLFASLARLGALPGADDLAALDDTWGRVDLAATGLSAEELAGLAGAQTGASAEDLLALLGAVAGDVTDLGPSEVRGVATTRYRAEIRLGDVLDAQGMSAADVAALAVADAGEVTIPFDIDVDAEDRVRRLAVVIDTSLIAELVGEPAPPGTEARIATIVELYDFGAEIDIADPAGLGAVDVTSAFLALAGS